MRSAAELKENHPGTEHARHSRHKLSTLGLMHLAVVYVVWSSTYLAIRVAVRPQSGFPPFMMCFTRMVVASLMLLGMARLRRERVIPERGELINLLVTGVLLWVGGNGLVIWAAQSANSGFVALMVSTSPIWVAVIEAALFRKSPGLRLAGALALGFAGLGVLSVPKWRHGAPSELFACVSLVFASVCWASGSIYQNRRPVKLTALASAAWQHLFASGGFLALSLAMHEPVPSPTPGAWISWGYLVVFGTLAFVSFSRALRLLPISVTMTYAYVNPVLAVALGWLVLSEPVTGWMVAGAALVILGVVGIFKARYTGVEAVGRAD